MLAAYLFSFAAFLLTEWGSARQNIFCEDCSLSNIHRFKNNPGLLFSYPVARKELPMRTIIVHGHYLLDRAQGKEYRSAITRKSISENIMKSLPPTLNLLATAAALSVTVAIPLSIGAALLLPSAEARRVGHRFLVILCVLAFLAYLTCIRGLVHIPGPHEALPARGTDPVIWPILALALVTLPSTVRLLSSLLSAFLHPPAPIALTMLERWQLAQYQVIAFLTRSSPLTVLAAQVSWLLLALLVVETFFERLGLAYLITNSVSRRDMYGLEPFLLALGLFLIMGHLALSIIRGWTERSSWFQAHQDLAARCASGIPRTWAMQG